MVFHNSFIFSAFVLKGEKYGKVKYIPVIFGSAECKVA